MLTYEPFLGGTRVLRDGQAIGVIQTVMYRGKLLGHAFFDSKTGKDSHPYPTVEAVKASLEG